MKDRLLHTPEGVRDIYNSECAAKLSIEEKIKDIFKIYSYETIETPTFEFFDIFSEERGTVKAKDMYKFFDREGNTLVLRPDMTPPIARCVAKYYKDSKLPVRLCYCASTYINSSEYQGKPKESTQLGVELIDDSSAYADAEIIAMTVDSMLAAGFTEFQVEVGEVAFFKAIVKEAGFDTDQIEELRHLIIDKNIFGLEDFLSKLSLSKKLQELFMMLPSLFGPFERLGEFKALTGNAEAIAAIERLEKIYEALKLYGYEKYISFDLGMLSKYSYYTGIIFNAYTYGIGDSLISGGRYDRLVGQFGTDKPAVGMAVYVDRMLAVITRQGKCSDDSEDKRVVILTGEDDYEVALSRAFELRKEGSYASVNIVEKLPDDDELQALLSELKVTAVEVIENGEEQ